MKYAIKLSGVEYHYEFRGIAGRMLFERIYREEFGETKPFNLTNETEFAVYLWCLLVQQNEGFAMNPKEFAEVITPRQLTKFVEAYIKEVSYDPDEQEPSTNEEGESSKKE